MPDNATFQSTTLATLPAGTKPACRAVLYSGDANALVAPVGLGVFSGADDAKTFTDVADSAPLPVKQVGGTTTVSSVAANASSVTLLSANVNRLRAWLYNDDVAKSCYVKFGTTASASSFTKKMLPGDFFEVPGYTGRIDAIWDATPSGSMRITEMTP